MGGGPPDLPPPAAPPNISLEGDSRLMDWDLKQGIVTNGLLKPNSVSKISNLHLSLSISNRLISIQAKICENLSNC